MPQGENRSAFCALAALLGGERPETYVGSAEHVRDVEELAAVAPDEIRTQVEIFRDFLVSGGIDPADPDSNLTDTWPAHVQAAVKEVTDYIARHC